MLPSCVLFVLSPSFSVFLSRFLSSFCFRLPSPVVFKVGLLLCHLFFSFSLLLVYLFCLFYVFLSFSQMSSQYFAVSTGELTDVQEYFYWVLAGLGESDYTSAMGDLIREYRSHDMSWSPYVEVYDLCLNVITPAQEGWKISTVPRRQSSRLAGSSPCSVWSVWWSLALAHCITQILFIWDKDVEIPSPSWMVGEGWNDAAVVALLHPDAYLLSPTGDVYPLEFPGRETRLFLRPRLIKEVYEAGGARMDEVIEGEWTASKAFERQDSGSSTPDWWHLFRARAR